jgi:hypothetical protein
MNRMPRSETRSRQLDCAFSIQPCQPQFISNLRRGFDTASSLGRFLLRFLGQLPWSFRLNFIHSPFLIELFNGPDKADPELARLLLG